MVAVIKGDIIASRKLKNPKKWLAALKTLLAKWGKTPKQWELGWGDLFQLELNHPEEALYKAIEIKALLKSISPNEDNKTNSKIDVRMAIGIGDKTFSAPRIMESNGPAFIFAGEKFEKLKKDKLNLAIQTVWPDFDLEVNLYLKLANIIMDNWSVSSAQLMSVLLKNREATQEEIGKILGIKQSSVSGRWNRAKIDEILELDQIFRRKLKIMIP